MYTCFDAAFAGLSYYVGRPLYLEVEVPHVVVFLQDGHQVD